MVMLKDGTESQDPRLDRLVEVDPLSKNFPIMATMEVSKPRSYTWSCGVNLNQGSEGACVGFSVSHEIAARPVACKGITDSTARALYLAAQYVDEWPGESYSGTSVLAGFKAATALGYFSEYRWAFGLDDLVLAVGYKGPAVLGINWYEGMGRTDAAGVIKVDGAIRGGHAILCKGVDIKKKMFKLQNSWGTDWGINGDCFISFDDVARLLQEGGDACIPVKRMKGK